MIYKMTLKDSVDTMTFNLLETPIVDKDIEGAVDNVTLDGNQYTDYLYLKKQYIQKWAIMCPDEYDELRGFYTRQFEDGEVPSYRVYYGANVTRDYTLNGDYLQFNAEGIETGMTLSQLLGNAKQTTYSGKNLIDFDAATLYTNASVDSTRQGNGFKSTIKSVTLPTYYNLNVTMPAGTYTLSFEARCQNSNSLLFNTQGYIFGGRGVLKDASGATASESYRTLNSTWKKFSFTITTTASMAFTTANALHLYFLAPDNTQVFELQNPMFEAGSSATEYEQYVGGTPAPNPSYPQPISTVTGAQNIKVTGKNLVEDTISGSSIDAIGRIRSNSDFDTQVAFVIEGETYTLSYTGETFVGGYFATKPTMNSVSIDGTRIVNNNKTFVAQYTGYFTFRTNAGESNAQCELGSTATAYEPYQGQSYEVNLGKNLFSISQDTIISNAYLNNNATLTFADLNSVSITATGTQGAQYLYRIISGLDSTKSYTFSFKAIKNVKGSTGLPYIRITTSGSNDGSTWTNLGFSGNINPTEGETYSFAKTLTGYSQYRFMIFNNVDTPVQIGETTTFFDMQLEEGAQTSFAPYFTPIELAKIGNYQDRIYKDDGKWYIEKNVGKVVLDGTETWSASGSVYYTTALVSTIIPTPSTQHYLGLSDYFEVVGFDYQSGTNLFFHPNKNLQVKNTNWATLNDWKTWLGSHNTTVYYPLATPTTTEITDETLLSQLNFLASLYGGENNISLVGTGAQGEMEVFIRDVMSVETDVVPEVPVRLTLTDDGVINACGCRRNVQLTMRETTE